MYKYKRGRSANAVWAGHGKRRKRRRHWRSKQKEEEEEEEEEETTQMTKVSHGPFKKLPVSLLLEIFSLIEVTERLAVVATVCKGWRALVMATLSSLRSVDLSRKKIEHGGPFLALMANNCPQLLSMKLSGVSLSDNRLEQVSKYFTHLERIDLSDAGRAINDTSIAVLCKNCTALRSIILRRCYNLGDPSGVALSECKNLEEVNMKFCHYLTSDGVRMIVASRGPFLKKMVFVRDCINSSSLAEILKHCNNLEFFGMQQSSIRGKELLELAKRCPKLRGLNVRYCIKVKEKDILRFHNLLPQCQVTYHKWSKKVLPPSVIIKKEMKNDSNNKNNKISNEESDDDDESEEED